MEVVLDWLLAYVIVPAGRPQGLIQVTDVFFVARIGATGGQRLVISVDGQPFISASVNELRTPWAAALESTLHNEVLA